MLKDTDNQEQGRMLIRRLDKSLTDSERQAIINWGMQLLAIRRSDKTTIQKAQAALEITRRSNIILPTLSKAGITLRNVLWKDRNWPTRIGLGTAAIAAVAFGSQGAGIAALGGAIGIPLWVVCGAGGVFIGTLIDELQRTVIRNQDRS